MRERSPGRRKGSVALRLLWLAGVAVGAGGYLAATSLHGRAGAVRRARVEAARLTRDLGDLREEVRELEARDRREAREEIAVRLREARREREERWRRARFGSSATTVRDPAPAPRPRAATPEERTPASTPSFEGLEGSPGSAPLRQPRREG